MKTALINNDPVPLNIPAIDFDFDLLPPLLRKITQAYTDQYQIDPGPSDYPMK